MSQWGSVILKKINARKKAYKTKDTYKLGIHKINFHSKRLLEIDSSTLVFDKYSVATNQTSVLFSMGFLAFTRK